MRSNPPPGGPRGGRPLHTKHGQRKLADMDPAAPATSVSPARALGLLAFVVASVGLVLSFTSARPQPLGEVPIALAHCARPIEQRPHVAAGSRTATAEAAGKLVCADDLELPDGVQLQAGDAWVQDAGGGWSRRPHAMRAPMRLLLDLPLHLNQATAQELSLLGGLNGRQARAIVAHRDRIGGFDSVESLLQVHGVGKKTWVRIAPHVQIYPQADEQAAPQPGHGRAVPQELKRGGSMSREWLVDVVARLPQGGLSRMWGWLARRRWPVFFVRLYQHSFVRAVGIDMAESEFPLQDYPSLQDLFGRRLRAGLRPIDPSPGAVVSPVDARIGACGTVDNGTLFQVKGRSYSLARLLGDAERAQAFEGGPYVTFYLAPKDYHRIHAPVAGAVTAAKLIPGSLFPVFEESLHKVDELFARNERIITYLRGADANAGELAVVKVGATLVGCITTTYDASLRGNVAGSKERDVHYPHPIDVALGGELGAFELGSTVVLIGQRGKFELAQMEFGQHVHVGERVGVVCASPERPSLEGAPVAPAAVSTDGGG